MELSKHCMLCLETELENTCIDSLCGAPYNIVLSYSNIILDLHMEDYKAKEMKQQPGPHIHHSVKIYLSHDSTLSAKPKQNRGPCVLILVPKTSSPLLICLFTLPYFHVQLH